MQDKNVCVELQKRLGARVRNLRLKRGWSQESFADHCDLHRTYMSSIERGLVNPSLCTLNTIAQGLEMTLGKLLAGIAADTPSKQK